MDILNNITKSCQVFQTYSPGPISFSVRFPDEAVSNKRIIMNLMYIDSTPVLHIVDAGTKFLAARFVPNVSTATIGETFVTIWINMYTGYPSHIHVDQGSAFNSIEWIELYREAAIQTLTSGTELHNSLGQGKTYHAMLRLVYNKI